MSPSCRLGYTRSGSGSRGRFRELDFEPGVPGLEPDPDPLAGAEFWRSRCGSVRRSPKLLRPLVEVEVRADPGCWFASESLSLDLPNELSVEDLPLPGTRGGTSDTDGVELPEYVDQLESCRTIVAPGDPRGALVNATADCVGEALAEPYLLGSVSNRTFDLLLGDIDLLPAIDSVGVWDREGPAIAGLGNFSGRGNKGPLSFFRLLSWKNVVVVEMVCVVVVLA